MLKVILIIIGIMFFVVLGVFFNFGAFTKVIVKEKEINILWIVYEKFTGPYKDTGPVMDKIYYDLLNKESIETYKGFGIYYDNPREVEPDKCRSIVGCIIEDRDIDKLEELRSNYNISQLSKSESVFAQFPYKGKMSIMMGIMKVYPKLTAYFEKNNIDKNAIMEIYNVPEKRIEYVSAIDPVFPDFEDF